MAARRVDRSVEHLVACLAASRAVDSAERMAEHLDATKAALKVGWTVVLKAAC